MKILIIEDDFTSRFVLQRILSEYGQPDIAVNGKEGLEAFKLSKKSSEDYELIFLDIMMPEMDGQEVLKEIRKIEEEKYGLKIKERCKIIMVTALSDYDNIKQSFNSLCDAYLVKPYKKEKIIETLKKLGLI